MTNSTEVVPVAMTQHMNAAALVYGESKSGKTMLLATLFQWVWTKYRKKSRYYAFDTGGYPDLMQALIRKGITEIYRPLSRDPRATGGLVTGTLSKVAQGAWPVTRDPLTGDAPPGVPLVMPTHSVWIARCEDGHEIGRAPLPTAFPQVCSCGKRLLSALEERQLADHFKDIGAIGFDSISSMGDWCMDELEVMSAKGVLGGLKGNMNTVLSDGETFGTAGMSAVGFGQNRSFDWLKQAALIPGLVVPPYFTALVDRGTDKQMGAVVYAPKIVGTARSTQVPREVGNLLVARREPDGAHRLYLRGFPGEQGTMYLAGVRSADISLPPYLEDPPGATLGGGLFSRFSLGYLHELLAESAQKVDAAVTALLGAETPGIGTGELSAADVAAAIKTQGSGTPLVVVPGAAAPALPVPVPTVTPGPAVAASAATSVAPVIPTIPTTPPPTTIPPAPLPAPTAAPTAAPVLAPGAPVLTLPLIAPAGSGAPPTPRPGSIAPITIPNLPTTPK